jgi:hypothetical protein
MGINDTTGSTLCGRCDEVLAVLVKSEQWIIPSFNSM